jgi:putative DNA primase/helicase
MSTTAPNTRPVMPQNIPSTLKQLDQWAAWRWEVRDGKWTKPPLNPSTGRYARNNDPDTWGSLDEAMRRMRKDRLAGVGFMFHSNDGLAGIDLDDCRNPYSGEVEPWATEIVRGLGSYTEVSPSERGLKVFVRGELPPERRRKGRIEMYDRGRFFTTTGHRLAGFPATVNEGQERLTHLHRRVFGEPAGQAAEGKRDGCENPLFGSSDEEIVDRAMRAANREKFARLWAGDTSDYADGDNEGRSEADLALCSILAFWVGPDEGRIDRLFRRSGLYRQKWERADYRALTLALALDREEFWNGEGAALFGPGRVYARRKGVICID